MWYLPRLMVYHVQSEPGGEAARMLATMERRLLRVIATPAMVATWLFGILLATATGAWGAGWLHAKLALVLALSALHGLLAREVGRLAQDLRGHRAGWYRAINEVPTVIFVLIVLLATFQPF